MKTWIPISQEKPPANEVVLTKIDDEQGIRNEAKLKLCSGLWWLPDGSMYVYYTPTHWLKVA